MIAAVPALAPRRVTLLLFEAALLVAAAFAPGYAAQLACLALAMGIQNTSISQFDGVRANTTFVTAAQCLGPRAVDRQLRLRCRRGRGLRQRHAALAAVRRSARPRARLR
jgi:hypothetical protein